MRYIYFYFHFFRLHATFCNVHSEVGYELVLGTSWLGYELAWYDLVRVSHKWVPAGSHNPPRASQGLVRYTDGTLRHPPSTP